MFAAIIFTLLAVLLFVVSLALDTFDDEEIADYLSKLREPKFPCASCVHCDSQSQYRCAACYEEITGKPELCAYARGTKQCAKSARKVS